MMSKNIIWMMAGVLLLCLCCPVVSALGQIAFSSNRHYVAPYYDNEIYVMDADGTNVVDMTNNAVESEDSFPAWSPDGTKIAFASTRSGGDRNIWVMDADGSHQQRLTGEMANENRPSWSPDGTKIAFASSRLGGHYDIYVMNADGTSQTRITTTAVDDYPAWSPFGSKIAFASYRDGNSEIYVMNADGTGQTRVTTNAANDNYPAWSPDGHKIAFTSNRDGNVEVYVMNADGTNQQRLTNNAQIDSEPAWSPDGAKIAFTSYRDGNYEIYVMNADGTGQTRITTNAAKDNQPSWGHLPASITVTSPNGGEKWAAGTSHTVTWTQAGLDTTNVQIDLWKYWPVGVHQRVIASSVPANQGSYVWSIPADVTPSGLYWVNISSLSYPEVSDYTDGWLEITSVPHPLVSVKKYISDNKYNTSWNDTSINVIQGVKVYYRVTVKNTGNCVLTSVLFADGNSYATYSMLQPGAVWNLYYSGTAGASDHTNLVTVGATSPYGNAPAATDTATYHIVKTLPGSSKPPTDPDSDGIYEDLNANGRLDFADVVLYFNQMTWIAANEPVSAFDCNDNGRIDFADIVALFNEI